MGMPLAVGTEAPDFTLKDQNNQSVTLSSYRGVKNVLLVFFPLAFTGICTSEFAAVRDELPKFQNDEVETIGISVGPAVTHKIWSAQNGYLFPILSDFWPHGAIADEYGVLNKDNGTPNRGTFVIDKAGVIRWAEMNQPGQPRDQSAWENALAALSS